MKPMPHKSKVLSIGQPGATALNYETDGVQTQISVPSITEPGAVATALNYETDGAQIQSALNYRTGSDRPQL